MVTSRPAQVDGIKATLTTAEASHDHGLKLNLLVGQRHGSNEISLEITMVDAMADQG